MLHSLGKLASPRVDRRRAGQAARLQHRSRCATWPRTWRATCAASASSNAATITHGAGIAGLDPEACAQAIAEGTLLGLYRFLRHKKADDEADARDADYRRARRGQAVRPRTGRRARPILAEAANFCRDLANEPANYLTPTEMADQAAAMAKETGLDCEIYGPDWMREKGMGGLLASRPAAPRSRASSSCATTAAAARRRWPSSARASPSTPAASRSSRPRTWAR